MAVNEPPYLTVGTDVSARYKGAFCEAKVKKVNRSVKCKVIFSNNLGTFILPDDQIRGTLRVNIHVEAKHPEKNQYCSAIITKIFDYSQYTVVFDDGDETTLRRTSLCLKSGRHFAESETLDQLPLTNPEHFGIPVLGSKSKRKRRSIASCSSMDGDSSSEELHSKRKRDLKKDYESDIAKVVCVDLGDKRKKDNWFPALIVSPTSQEIKINSKDYYLVRSFKDGKYYQVKKKETRMFTKEIGAKVENNLLKTAVEKANLYLNKDEIPPHWDWDLMMGRDDEENDYQDSDIETSDDEPSEEKDRFVAQLYKFMDERGTPINRAPTVSGRDLNLYKLFNIVQQMGGYNRVTNQNKWRTIYTKMGLVMTNPACSIQIKKAYKRYLHSFEDFNRKLGCTMVSNTRSGHTRYRSDRNIIMTRKREQNLPLIRSRLSRGAKIKNQQKNEESLERRSRLSRLEENENAKQKEESKSPNVTEQKREKIETRGSLKNEQEKSKFNLSKEKKKEKPVCGKAKEEKSSKEKTKINTKDMGKDKNPLVKVKVEEDKEQFKKKIGKIEEKDSGEKVLTDESSEVKTKRNETVVRIGDRVRVKYGNGKQHKKYEAKVLKIERESGERKFYVHYTGWNVRYDEWIRKNKIVEVVESKSGSDRKKKNALWPSSKSQALVKRSRLFELSLRKASTSSVSRRRDGTSDLWRQSSWQTAKPRRKLPDLDESEVLETGKSTTQMESETSRSTEVKEEEQNNNQKQLLVLSDEKPVVTEGQIHTEDLETFDHTVPADLLNKDSINHLEKQHSPVTNLDLLSQEKEDPCPVQLIDHPESPNDQAMDSSVSGIKVEFEESGNMDSKETLAVPSLPEIKKIEQQPDLSLSSDDDDNPPPLERKPDFIPTEERYETRPVLERAVSEEPAADIPCIYVQESLEEETIPEDITTDLESKPTENLASILCGHNVSKAEEWTDGDGDTKTSSLLETEHDEPEAPSEDADLSGKSEPEQCREAEQKKVKKDKKKKLKKFGKSDPEKNEPIKTDYSRKDGRMGEEERTGSDSSRTENCKKTKRCVRTKDGSESLERKTKRKKKKKDLKPDQNDEARDDGNSSDSDEASKPDKDRKKSKRKTRLSQSDRCEDGSIRLPEKVNCSEDFSSDLNRSVDDASFLLCQERVPASPTEADADTDSRHPDASSSLSSEPEQSDISLNPVSESSVDFSTNTSSEGAEIIQDVIHAAEASAVLDNTPPTTPESAPSYLSGSPTYHQEGASSAEGDPPKEADSDCSPGEIDRADATESEDSLSHTESAILFLANRAVSRKIDSRARSTSMLKRRLSEAEEMPVPERKRPSKRSTSDVYRCNGGKRNSKSAKGERREPGPHRCSLPASSQNRTSKFNFYVPLEAYTDPDKRIAILQDSLSELKKTYMALKAEVALIDRHRKKAKKKEREGVSSTQPGLSSRREVSDS